MRTLLAFFLAVVIFGGLATAQTTSTNLGRGFNFGDMLDAPKEGEWGATVEEDYFNIIHEAGFTLLRVPIRWSAHVSPGPDFTIDPTFLARVDWIADQAEKNQLTILLDYHNDDALMKEPDANADRFVAIWKQVAEHYRAAPDSVLFELLNEPNGKLDGPRWNDLIAKTLPVVRASNPTRTVVIGPAVWNSIGTLSQLVLPEDDRHLLVTVHFYDPMTFTHQGASWVEGSDHWLGNTWQGTDAEKGAITKAFDTAAAWGEAHHRPMYLGEFGAFSKGDMASRARWTAWVVHSAEAHEMPWTYWEFCSGFGAYDPAAKAWREPLLGALQGK
jgi:endoglucanase